MESDHQDVPSDEFEARSAAFLHWFNDQPDTRLNPKIVLTDLRFRNAGRGVTTTADLAYEEELFAIPHTLALTTTSSRVPEEVRPWIRNIDNWTSQIVVIIYEFLQGDRSLWYSYFQLLPKTFDTLMFWTREQLSELQGSAVLEKIGKKQAEDHWESVIMPFLVRDEDYFPLPSSSVSDRRTKLENLAHMAGSLIMAYAFDIDEGDSMGGDDDETGEGSDLTEDDEDNPAKGMIPFADMLNADAHRNNARLYQEDGFFIMRTTKSIKAGEEILNDYGPLPRSDLLRMYGYVSDNYSLYDVVEIPLKLILDVAASSGVNRPYLQRSSEELQRLGLIEDAIVISRAPSKASLNEMIPTDLRMIISVFNYHPDTFNFSEASLRKTKPDLSLSEASLMTSVVTNRLSEYKTSLSGDSNILARLQNDKASSKRYRMAVQVRKGEKEILHALLTSLEQYVADQTHLIARESTKRGRDEEDVGPAKKK